MLTSYKVIFFDAGGTLFHPYPSVGAIYRDVAKKYGAEVDAGVIEHLFHQAWLKRDGLSHLSSHQNEKIEKDWWYSLVKEVFSQVTNIQHFDAFFEELYHVFGGPEVWHLFDDTIELLEKLKLKKRRMAIVSNWDSRLFQLCEGLGLGEYLDFILASAVFGAAKPSPKIFKEALKKAGVQPHEAVHIGDSLEDDIQGALGAGLSAIFLDRKKTQRHEKHPLAGQFQTVHSLKELMD